jgi:hypothetical protein
MLRQERRAVLAVVIQETECLALMRWEFEGKLKVDAETSAVILAKPARRFQKALAGMW